MQIIQVSLFQVIRITCYHSACIYNNLLKYPPQAEEEEKPAEEQTEFLVRLVKFADDSKIKVIKEIKGVMEGINLVQVSQ